MIISNAFVAFNCQDFNIPDGAHQRLPGQQAAMCRPQSNFAWLHLNIEQQMDVSHAPNYGDD